MGDTEVHLWYLVLRQPCLQVLGDLPWMAVTNSHPTRPTIPTVWFALCFYIPLRVLVH